MKKSYEPMLAILLISLALPLPVSAGATAIRSMPDSVNSGSDFNVVIKVSGYGQMGQVLETLPAGFSLSSSTLDPMQVGVSGNRVNFTLIGGTDFTYTVHAPTAAGTYSFNGILKDENKNPVTVSGDTQIAVISSSHAGNGMSNTPAVTSAGQTVTPQPSKPDVLQEDISDQNSSIDVTAPKNPEVSTGLPDNSRPKESIESGLIGLFALLSIALIYKQRAGKK